MSVAIGENGGVSGLVAGTGAKFNAKITQWRAAFAGRVWDTTGFGDTTPDNQVGTDILVRGAFVGQVKTDTAATPGIKNMGSTTNSIGTVTLQWDTGRTASFTATIFNIQIQVDRTGGPAQISGQFQSKGAVTETGYA